MKTSIMLWVVCALSFLWSADGQEVPDNLEKMEPGTEFFPLRITARIVDERGQPIEGADINLGIANAVYKDEFNNFLGKSSADGTFSAESPAFAAYVKFFVTKKGYYTSQMNYKKFERRPEQLRILKRFEPWNPTVDIVLKKIGKPIPMIVRRPDMKAVPVTGADVPFDLLAWDWLPPHGMGKVSDLIFNFEVGEKVGEYPPLSMTMRFANEHDGLNPIKELRGVESRLIFPREAPESGYNMKTFASTLAANGHPAVPPENSPFGYFIRLRTQVDAEGRILSAYYGKIIRTDLQNRDAYAIDISSPGGVLAQASFKFAAYYINPTPNDRNLEYDQFHNLAPDIEPGYQWAP